MNLNKKVFLIITVSLLVLLLVIIVGINLVKINNTKQEIYNSINKTQLEKNLEKQVYNDYQKLLAATYQKNVDGCQAFVKLKSVNECINSVAVQSHRKDYCEKITANDTLKNECLDAIDYIIISWGDDPNKCSTLSSLFAQDNCFKEYFVKLNNLNQCDAVNDNTRKLQCSDLVNERQALVFNKPEACNLITDELLKNNCQKNIIVPPLDTDQDGLPDDIELSFGTNPLKADTDSDGISDYNEINKYHTNPLQAEK